MNSGIRDNFPPSVVLALRERVNGHCSNPGCGCPTLGPNADSGKATRIGVAAHITAASPGGPRYDSSLTSEERSSIANGVYLCENCARRIDVDPLAFPVGLLLDWKRRAEEKADAALGRPHHPTPAPPPADTDAAFFMCPHCHTAISDGQTVCLGCRGQVLLGATVEERKIAMGAGAMSIGFPTLWLYDKLGIPLIDAHAGSSGMFPLIVGGILALAGGVFAVVLVERYWRQRSPRVFVQRLV